MPIEVALRIADTITEDTTQSEKRHLKDVLKMPYEETQDISARCLLDV